MKNFIEYIEESCKNIKDSHISYIYKKKILDEMTERANEITRAGLKDEKVLADLIADEYPDLEANYYAFEKAEKKKAKAKLRRIILGVGGALFFIAIFVAYFAISAETHLWAYTWLIIVGGIFSMIIFYTAFLIKWICRQRKIFHIIARILLAGCIMLATVFAFLFVLMLFNLTASWPIIIIGVVAALIADLFFAFRMKHKFRTIALFAYMPAISTLVYVILAGYGVVSWLAGWPIILLGLVADLIIVAAIGVSNAKYFMYKQEDDD